MLLIALLTIVANQNGKPELLPVDLKSYPQLISSRYTQKDGIPRTGAERIKVADGVVTVTFADRWAQFDGRRWLAPMATLSVARVQRKGLPQGAWQHHEALTKSGDLWISTDHGTFKGKGESFRSLELPRTYKPNQPGVHADAEIRDLVKDNAGTIWLATSEGLYATDGA